MATNTLSKLPRWDLSCFYSGIDDSAIGTDLTTLAACCAEFQEKFKGNVSTLLGSALEEYEQIELLEKKLDSYFYLSQSVDLENEMLKSRCAAAKQKMAEMAAQYKFFEYEIMELSEADISMLASCSEIVQRYIPWLSLIRAGKLHRLPLAVEETLAKMEELGATAWEKYASGISDHV